MGGPRRNDGIGDLVRGALAGLLATWAMGRATTLLYEREDLRAREREDTARGGRTAFGSAAEKGAGLLGRTLTEEERGRAGSVIHWALGAGAGTVYGALRGRVPGVDAANGLVFGTAFFLAVDEGANTLLGLTPPPGEFPWQAHARGLAGHLVFGMSAELALRAMKRISR